jgi:ABC-2 type transport system ATP-binding protein
VLDEIERLADDLVIIAGGRVAATGTVASVTGSRPSLEAAFLELTTGEDAIR